MTNEIKTNATFARGIRMHHATRAKALKLQMTLLAEYPRLVLEAIEGDEIEGHEALIDPVYVAECGGFTVTHEDAEEPVYSGDKVPELAEILDTAIEMGLDLEADEEEEKPSGSVVPEEYRIQYKEKSSNGQTCGDWLAEFLVGQTHNAQGFNVEDFTYILNRNDVDMTAKWAKLPESGQPGWIGRYRMNGRQVLERLVAERGWVNGIADRFIVPEADMAILRTKHAKHLAKLERAAAKAEAEAAKAATETAAA